MTGFEDYQKQDWFVIVQKEHRDKVRMIPGFHGMHHKRVIEKTLLHFEFDYFLDHQQLYKEVLSTEDGKVFEPIDAELLITCSKQYKKDHENQYFCKQ
jgi:hypothetical protein